MKIIIIFRYVLAGMLACCSISVSAQYIEPPETMVQKCVGVSGYELLCILSEAYMVLLDKCEKELKNNEISLESVMEVNNLKEKCKVYRSEFFSLLRKKIEARELVYTFGIETLTDFDDFVLSPDLEISEIGCTYFNEVFVTFRCNIKLNGKVEKLYGYQTFENQLLNKKYSVTFVERQKSYYYTLYLGSRKVPQKISINGFE